ncbi:MAG: hypothetical protein QM564_02785 [Bergeyella sp.]
MKKYISIIAVAVSGVAFSQVIIGDEEGTAADKTSVLLEFAEGQNKGLILPYVTTLPTDDALVPGVIVLDATTATAAAVKYYAPGNALADANGWVNLSNTSTADVSDELADQPATTEDTGAKTIIGAATSTADGVLVLESTTKAMVLPTVASTDDVPDPAPGMMVYINGTNKRLAVFNGLKWTYWKP